MSREVEGPRHIVVTGASRGLGLGFARRWLERGERVFALARDPAAAPALGELAGAHPESLRVQQCDVADDASVETARRAVEAVWERVDILVNNAGICGAREDALGALDFGELRRVFEVNAVGPLRVARAFLPLLGRGARPRVVHISSLMGSIDDNGSGGAYAYRMSKAALNMASRNLGHELRRSGILSVALHPGWVRTDMGGPGGRLSVEEAVASLASTIDRLGPEHNGGFYDLEGQPAPW
ncbi:MAG: SDR family oxidoreductase [Acidobacteriota bacterium]